MTVRISQFRADFVGGMMFVASLDCDAYGARYGLLLASGIMIVRIAASGLAIGPIQSRLQDVAFSRGCRTGRSNSVHRVSLADAFSMVYLVVQFRALLGPVVLLAACRALAMIRIGFQQTYFLMRLRFDICWGPGSPLSDNPTEPADAHSWPGNGQCAISTPLNRSARGGNIVLVNTFPT